MAYMQLTAEGAVAAAGPQVKPHPCCHIPSCWKLPGFILALKAFSLENFSSSQATDKLHENVCFRVTIFPDLQLYKVYLPKLGYKPIQES